MKKMVLVTVVLLAFASVAAGAKPLVTLTASPNPATVGQKVSYGLDLAIGGPLQVWVSGQGFAQPRMGSLPAGTWSWECCPPQTAGTAAWHYRSSASAPPGSYRFGADARHAGRFLSSAQLGSTSTSLWVQVI